MCIDHGWEHDRCDMSFFAKAEPFLATRTMWSAVLHWLQEVLHI